MAKLTLKPIWTDKLTIIEKNDPVEGGVEGIDNKPHIEMANNIAYVKKMVEDSDETIEELEKSIDKIDNTVKEFSGEITDEDGTVTLKALLNRIKELEENSNKIPINGLFYTTKHYQSDGDVAQALGYGVWQRALQGRVAVGFSAITTDPVEYRTHGLEYGTFEHILTTDEIPNHKHSQNEVYNKYIAQATDVTDASWKTMDTITQHSPGSAVKNYEIQTTGFSNAGWEAATEVEIGNDQAHPNQPPSKTTNIWERIG